MAWARARRSLRLKGNRMHTAVVVVAGLSGTMHAARHARACWWTILQCHMFGLGTAGRPTSLPRRAQVAMQLLGQTGEGGSRATRHHGDRIDSSPIPIARKLSLAAVVIFSILNFKQRKIYPWPTSFSLFFFTRPAISHFLVMHINRTNTSQRSNFENWRERFYDLENEVGRLKYSLSQCY
jgi:hypothetical protein